MTAPWIVAFAVVSVTVAALAIIVLGFLRRAISVLEAAEARLTANVVPFGGAPPGTTIPPFTVRNREGEVVRSADLVDRGAVFLFVSSDCEPCRPLLEELQESDWMMDVPLVAILGDSVTNRAVSFPRNVQVFYQSEREAAKAFESIATPQAFGVAHGGIVIKSTIPQSTHELRHLAESLEGGDLNARSQWMERIRA